MGEFLYELKFGNTVKQIYNTVDQEIGMRFGTKLNQII